MSSLLASPWKALSAGLMLALGLGVLHALLGGGVSIDAAAFVLRWIHVIAAIVWIGLVWFVNFVQLPALGKLDDAGKAVIMKAIAPSVAWWFRHAATVTVAAGLALAAVQGTLFDVLTLGAGGSFAVPRHTLLGIGIWLAIVMFVFVWFLIWPNLKIVLGQTPGDAAAKNTARGKVLKYARMNLMLSMPVTFAMVAAQNLF